MSEEKKYCMDVLDMIRLIESCARNGVANLKVDNFEVSFHNKEKKYIDTDRPSRPESEDTPNPDIVTELPQPEIMDKAEELALMAIENPEKFEEMLVNDDELLKEFSQEVEEE